MRDRQLCEPTTHCCGALNVWFSQRVGDGSASTGPGQDSPWQAACTTTGESGSSGQRTGCDVVGLTLTLTPETNN